MDTVLIGFLICLIPIAMVLWWCFVVWLIAQISGWSRLGQKYQSLHEPAGERHEFQSLRLGLANYKHTVLVILADEGLYMRVFVLFRPGHPALLIPWRELFDPQETSFFFFKIVKISIGNPALATLSLSSTLYGRIQVFMENRLDHIDVESKPAG